MGAVGENYFIVAMSQERGFYSLHLWDLRTDTFTELIEVRYSGFRDSIQFLFDDKFIAVIGDYSAFIWDIEAHEIAESVWFSEHVFRIFFDDNSLIAFHNPVYLRDVVGPNYIRVWNFDERLLSYEIEYNEFLSRCSQFSPLGKFLLVGYHLNMDLFDAQTGVFITTLPYSCGRFNYDASQIVVGESNNHSAWLYVLDTSTFEQLHQLNLNSNMFYSADFSPVVNLLLVQGENVMQIWDTDTGGIIYSRTMSQMISNVSFNREGNLIIVDMQDGTVRILAVQEE